jgi:primosomal protein N' (replication factor Y)
LTGGIFLDLVFDIPLGQKFTYRIDEKGEAEPGRRAMAPLGRRDVLGYIVARRESPPSGIEGRSIKPIRRVVDKEILFDKRDLDLAEWIAGYYFCGLGQALAAMIPSGKRAGDYIGAGEEIAETPLELSEEQQRALREITKDYGNSPVPYFYLYGITGSGKTEVFLRAAESILRGGKSVIYLVPEISLTHQTAELIRRRFGETAAAIHSGMSPSARLTEWMRIRRGEARIVAGPRSAVFAPVKNLGLIIIDEEQDGSYKSGNTPRYHARQTAMRRCAVEGARLVMGSATPSAEAWKLMEETGPPGKAGGGKDGGRGAENGGGIRRLNLTRRLAGGTVPSIVPVSLERCEGCLSPELKAEILKTARMKRQTILFLNRRGFAYFYHCPSCGYELNCRHCSVSLTYHKAKGRALCHYCGYSIPPPSVCPQCGSLEAGFSGIGTEMIEEEVRRTFPELRIARADADTTARKGSLKETLDRFRSGEIDLLLGTQMVAKGLNFPGVRLVGVVLADTGLQLPDFRAAERTFSLIVQVAGRSGRYFPDGRVIVQTFRPRDPAILLSCALDVEGFFTSELEHRKALSFPPYTRLIRFTLRSREAEKARGAAERLAGIAGPLLPPDADALGPAECPLSLIGGNHRQQLILRGRTMGSLHGAAGAIIREYEKGKDSRVYLEVDVDPVSLL